MLCMWELWVWSLVLNEPPQAPSEVTVSTAGCGHKQTNKNPKKHTSYGVCRRHLVFLSGLVGTLISVTECFTYKHSWITMPNPSQTVHHIIGLLWWLSKIKVIIWLLLRCAFCVKGERGSEQAEVEHRLLSALSCGWGLQYDFSLWN